jgi:hypothetical protein
MRPDSTTRAVKVGGEIPADQVRSRSGLAVLNRQVTALAAGDTADVALAHETRR